MTAARLAETYDLYGDLTFSLPRPAAEATMAADALSAYLGRLRGIEPLTAEEQQALAVRYIEHDDAHAGKMLIITNLRLVVKISREYRRSDTPLLDLIQEGNVGLSIAITRFDPTQGVKFTSYAQYWIRAMVLNYLMANAGVVRIGGSRAGRKIFYNLSKARRALNRRGITDPTPSQIADHLDVDESEVVRVSAQLTAPPVYLDAPLPGHERTTYGESLTSEVADPEELACASDIRERVAARMVEFAETRLSDDRERAVWSERMLSNDPETLVDLGDRFDVSKERIRQIEMQLRERFRRFLLSSFGTDLQVEYLQPN